MPNQWVQHNPNRVEQRFRQSRPLDGSDTLRSVGQVKGFIQVVRQDADHLAKTQGDDSQVVAAQAKHRRT